MIFGYIITVLQHSRFPEIIRIRIVTLRHSNVDSSLHVYEPRYIDFGRNINPVYHRPRLGDNPTFRIPIHDQFRPYLCVKQR